jgi:hypothetical protein
MKLPKLVALTSFALVLSSGAGGLAAGDDPLSTERRVHGVITSVEPAVVSITSANRTVTGKIDPARTKVRIHGKAAKLSDLKVTSHAKAELCLDDVWLVIDAHDSH